MENGNYYSADNGFACAAAGRGVKEALQEHLNIIVRNDELATEVTDSKIQEKINALAEDKERLEQQKLDRQEGVDSLTNTLDEKKVELSKLRKELEHPSNTAPSPDPRIEEWKREIDENNSILDSKEVEEAELKTDLDSPTQSELTPLAIEGNPLTQFTSLEKGFAVLTACVLLGLVVYLFVFYASVGDRTFTEGIGSTAQKRHIIIPNALSEAWNDDPKNWFVITFPFIFLTLAVIFYYVHEHANLKWMIVVLGATFVIDAIIAVKISQQMHEFTEGADVAYLWSENLTEILSVLFLGFGVSLLLGYGLYWVLKVWKGVKPHQEESEQLGKLIRAEKNDRLVQLRGIEVQIQQLAKKNSNLENEIQGYENNVEASLKQPVKEQIAGLEAECEGLESRVKEFNEQVESLQREINRCETDIESLFDRQYTKVIDIKKLESQANEFVAGWCRYVVQKDTRTPDGINQQITDIQDIANQTIESYVASLKGN